MKFFLSSAVLSAVSMIFCESILCLKFWLTSEGFWCKDLVTEVAVLRGELKRLSLESQVLLKNFNLKRLYSITLSIPASKVSSSSYVLPVGTSRRTTSSSVSRLRTFDSSEDWQIVYPPQLMMCLLAPL